MSRQKHRGLHPKDEDLFAPDQWVNFADSILDLFYLRSKNYGDIASLKIAGDRYRLQKRQRYALARIVSSKDEIRIIQKNMIAKGAIKDSRIYIDGFNLLIFAEVVYSDGLIFECLDGTFRDIASIHGNYQPIEETKKAVLSIGQVIEGLHPKKVIWYLDAPVSNSGRLKKLILAIAKIQSWNWEVELVPDVDQVLIDLKGEVVLTSDRIVLSKCEKWFNFSKHYLKSQGFKHRYIITLDDLGLEAKQFAS